MIIFGDFGCFIPWEWEISTNLIHHTSVALTYLPNKISIGHDFIMRENITVADPGVTCLGRAF